MCTPLIQVDPLEGLFDSKISIKISNLLPEEIMTIKANMIDQFGHCWESFARFYANEDGCIDISYEKPIEGTYEKADAMGLFWSMKRMGKKEGISGSALEPIFITLRFFMNDRIINTVTLKRSFLSEKVVRKPIREKGVVGTYFYQDDKDVKQAIIYLGGSEGGLMERKAALLASHGFAVLDLAYFGMEDLPAQLVEIPLEYIENAVHWLLSKQEVDSSKGVQLVGISKGAELALLSASMFKEITSVVGIVPSSVVYPGLGSKFSSSWSYHGNPVPYVGGDIPANILEENHRKKEQGEPIQYRDYYLARLEQVEDNPVARIPVEQIQGDILLISGDDDQLWPSDVHSEMVMELLRKASFPYYYQHLKYKGAGHSFYIPNWPTAYTQIAGYGDIQMDLGGNPVTTAFAQADSWNKILDFLKKRANCGQEIHLNM